MLLKFSHPDKEPNVDNPKGRQKGKLVPSFAGIVAGCLVEQTGILVGYPAGHSGLLAAGHPGTLDIFV